MQKRNSYKVMKSTTSETCMEEIKALIAILIKAAALKDNHLTTIEMWDNLNGHIWYRALMSRDRFNFLLNCLRFDDKSTRLKRKETDPFAPIREIWEKFIHKCKSCYSPSEFCTLDEQLLAFQGRCSFKMYIPNKPSKYGIKIVMLCDFKTKYMLNAEVYLGKGTHTEGLGLAEYFIMNLASPIFGSKRNITMDNWFTSVSVAKKLLQVPHEITIVETLRKNKPEIPPEMLEVRKENVEKAKFCFNDKLTMLSYQSKPHKNVILLSTMHVGEDFIGNKPEMIHFYNSTKGGVDAFDQMSAQMSCSRKTRRWPLCIFYGMLNTTIINSWIIFKENTTEDCKRRNFALTLANELGEEWMKTSESQSPNHSQG